MTTSVLCTPLLAQTILFRLQPHELSLFLHIIPPLHYFFDLLTHQLRHFTNLILAAVMVGMDNGEIDEGPRGVMDQALSRLLSRPPFNMATIQSSEYAGRTV
jgi:hypothetical protein